MDKEQLRKTMNSSPADLLRYLHNDRRETILKQIWEITCDESEAKEVRKSAKKTLYMLKSGGIDVDRFKPEKPREEGGTEGDETILSPVLSIPDSTGNSHLVIPLMKARSGSLTVYQFLIHMERGVLRFSAGKGSKKYVQKLIDQNPDYFPVPPAYAVYRLNRALQTSDGETVTGLKKLPSVLLDNGGEAVEHPVLALVPAQVSRIVSPDEEKNLLQMKEIASMSLPDEDIEEYRRQVRAAKESKLILDNKSPEERVNEVVERFLLIYFTPRRRDEFRVRMLDIALAYYHRGLYPGARMLIDFANQLISGRTIAREQQREHPLIRFLLYKAFMYV